MCSRWLCSWGVEEKSFDSTAIWHKITVFWKNKLRADINNYSDRRGWGENLSGIPLPDTFELMLKFLSCFFSTFFWCHDRESRERWAVGHLNPECQEDTRGRKQSNVLRFIRWHSWWQGQLTVCTCFVCYQIRIFVHAKMFIKHLLHALKWLWKCQQSTQTDFPTKVHWLYEDNI